MYFPTFKELHAICLMRRVQIEQLYNDYKNLLDFDTSYFQFDGAMEERLFLNHLSLMTYYRISEAAFTEAAGFTRTVFLSRLIT